MDNSTLAIILSADPWAMPDEKTGEILKGVSVWFVNQYRESADSSHFGFKPVKIGGTPEILAKLKKHAGPILARMVYGARPGAAGKATLVLNDFEFVKAADMFDLGLKKAA